MNDIQLLFLLFLLLTALVSVSFILTAKKFDKLSNKISELEDAKTEHLGLIRGVGAKTGETYIRTSRLLNYLKLSEYTEPETSTPEKTIIITKKEAERRRKNRMKSESAYISDFHFGEH
jgi:hypothetical protein